MIRRLSILILCTFFGVLNAGAQTSPEILTANVLLDNSVDITFNQISYVDFINEFPSCQPTNYIVKRANDILGPYDEIDNLPYDLTVAPIVYNDPSAQAHLGERFYIVEIEANLGGCLIQSNILASVHLELVNINQGAAQLDWNVENITMGDPTAPIGYELQKRVSAGPWLTLFATNGTIGTFYAEIFDCHGSDLDDPPINIEYRYKIVHTPGVTVFSNEVNGDFRNKIAPLTPVLETISVNPITEVLELYWKPSVEEDVGGYKIQYLDNGEFGLDEVFDPFASNYNVLMEPNDYKSGLQVVSYYILPFDDCTGAAAALNLSDPDFFSTMFLESSYSECDQSIQLNWTPYNSWESGVERYRVSAFIDGAQAVVVGDDIQSTSYTIENVQQNAEYLVYVTAISNDSLNFRNAHSNKIKEVTDYGDVAQNFGIDNVSVVGDQETLVTLYFDQDPSIQDAAYRLEKLNQFGDGFETVGNYPQNIADADGKLVVTDFDVDNRFKGDLYKLTATDFCGNDVSTSPTSNSVHLEVFAEDDSQENTLTWNPYEYWEDGVQEFRIYFSHTTNMPEDPKFVLDPDAFFKIDDIDEFFQTESDFCYRVDAIKRTTINNPLGATSKSNVKCITHKPLFFLPNAMVINGQNPIFKPEGGFIDFASYEMTIYDRWGTLLFETDSFFEGWDGSYNGDYVRDGAYAYFIRYQEGDGKEKFQAGVLTVLRAF